MIEGLKFPANAMEVIQNMIDLATFDLLPTEFLDAEIYYWPEMDPYTVNFEMAGIESLYFLANIGFVLYLIYLYILAVLIHGCLKASKSTAKCTKWLSTKLSSKLYDNGGLNRLFMTVFLDMIILSTLNLHIVDWNT